MTDETPGIGVARYIADLLPRMKNRVGGELSAFSPMEAFTLGWAMGASAYAHGLAKTPPEVAVEVLLAPLQSAHGDS